MNFSSEHGTFTASPFTPVLPISEISAAKLSLEKVCFTLETAEQIALITENSRTQLSMIPSTRLFYLIVHESVNTGWVAAIDYLRYAGLQPASEVIEQAAAWRTVSP